MSHLFKYVILTGAVICLALTIQAQVRLNLTLLPDQQTYLVSIIPEQSWDAPMNIVGSAQIVLQMDAGKPFLAGQIKSLIPGVSWSDNAYVESPASASGYNFVCFALNEPGTKKIAFQSGVEMPLFTFVNLEPGCVGSVQLVENQSTLVQDVVNKDKINITQNITVLGAGGNAISGIANKSVDCTVLSLVGVNTIVDNLRIYPVPAKDVLQIFWENLPGNPADKLLVFDMLGRQKAVEALSIDNGEQHIRLDVGAYPTGLYTAYLTNIKGERQSFRFVISHL